MNILMLSGCAPFQLNLPGSCSISQSPQHNVPAEKEKKGFFSRR